MRWLIVCLLLITACASEPNGTVIELRVDDPGGFGTPTFEDWVLEIHPLERITIATAEVDGSTVGGSTCQQIIERHATATGCVEEQTQSIRFDTEPLAFRFDRFGEAYVDLTFDTPVFVEVTHQTVADSLCDWSGGERLLPGTRLLILEVAVACQ